MLKAHEISAVLTVAHHCDTDYRGKDFKCDHKELQWSDSDS